MPKIFASREEMTQPISLPLRADIQSTPLGSKASSRSPASNSGIARVSWNDEKRSPGKKDIEDYLLTYLLLHPDSTKVEMRMSKCSAFVFCSSEEGASTSKRASYVRTVRYLRISMGIQTAIWRHTPLID